MVFYNHIRYRSRALGMKPRANGRNIVGCYILRLFTHPVANLRSGPSLAVLIHSLLRHPLQSETKTEPDLRLPRCMFLRVVGNCCVRFETSKLTISNSNSIWNARTRLNEFIRTPMCFVGKQAIYNLQFFFTSKTFEPTTPNISFVQGPPKRSSTMLDPFAQLFQQRASHMV